MSRLSNLGDRGVSFAQFLGEYCNEPELARRRETAINFVEGFDAAPAERISAKALARAEQSSGQEGGLRSLRLISGFDQIIEVLRQTIDPELGSIQLPSIVSAVRWKRGQVEIESHGPAGELRPTVRARVSIITLPVGVLRAQPPAPAAIRFEPDVPEKRQAASQLEMGSVVKILIRFKTIFWQDRRLGTLGPDDRLDRMAFLNAAKIPFATWWSFFPVHCPVLVGWAGGPSATSLIGQSLTSILGQAISTLSVLLGLSSQEIESQIEQFWVCDWQTDPFARGAYSYVPVGAMDAAESLGKPVANTLFFAGEATDAQTFGGTVDSAIATGRSAARQILQLWPPRAISYPQFTARLQWPPCVVACSPPRRSWACS